MTHYTGTIPTSSKRKADWRDDAACAGVDSDDWFPHSTNTTAIHAIKQVCFGCPVMIDCAQYALTTRQDIGVWGGLSESQRNTFLTKHRAEQLKDRDYVQAAVLRTLQYEINPLGNLRDVWNERTHPLPGGHLGWQGTPNKGSFTFRGDAWTPKQLAFYLDRGYKATGIIRRTPDCPVIECVHPRHILDNEERRLRKQAAQLDAIQAAIEAADLAS
jgi:hypothetical protein